MLRQSIAILAVVCAACGSRVAVDVDLAGPSPVPASDGVAVATTGPTSDPQGTAAPATEPTTSPTAPPVGRPQPGATADAAPPSPAGGTPTTSSDGEVNARGEGTYTYATSGTSSTSFTGERPMPATTTLEVEPADGATQVSVRDLRDRDGRGSVTRSTLVFGADGVRLARVHVTTVVGGFTDERTWVLDPPALISTPDAAPGDRLTFTMDDGETRADVTIDILREEDVVVGGTTVRTVVARSHTVLSGDVEGEQTTTSWIRRQDFLPVREVNESDVRSGPVRAQTSYRAELRALDPS